jgi:hypothetical protein
MTIPAPVMWTDIGLQRADDLPVTSSRGDSRFDPIECGDKVDGGKEVSCELGGYIGDDGRSMSYYLAG